MPGPVPKPAAQRRRRNPTPGARMLPAAGRPGPPPPWPLGGWTGDEPAPHLAELWAALWASPQAAAWEPLGLERVVARYAALVVRAEDPEAPASLLAEVRQLEDRLGLNPLAAARLRWEVDEPEAPAPGSTGAAVSVLDHYRGLVRGDD